MTTETYFDAILKMVKAAIAAGDEQTEMDILTALKLTIPGEPVFTSARVIITWALEAFVCQDVAEDQMAILKALEAYVKWEIEIRGLPF